MILVDNSYLKAKKFAKKYYFEDVNKHPYKWRGYDVYDAVCVKNKELNQHMVAGCDELILVNDNEVRWTDGDESLIYYYDLYRLEHPDEEDDEEYDDDDE